jgi:hypothetical protein
MGTKLFVRSPHRDAILELLATAPAEGVPTAVIMQIDGVGSRNNADQLLSRMVRAGEITRRGIGRYGPPRRPPDVAQPITPAPPQQPVAPIAHQAAEPQPEPRKAILRDVHEAAVREEDLNRLFGHRKEPFAAPRRDDQRPAERPAIDFETLVATISCKYGKHGLCPPFRLRDFARSWINDASRRSTALMWSTGISANTPHAVDLALATACCRISTS